MLREITGELAAIHRHLVRVLADMTESAQAPSDDGDVAQVRPATMGGDCCGRLELAVDVMSAELEKIEQRQHDD